MVKTYRWYGLVTATAIAVTLCAQVMADDGPAAGEKTAASASAAVEELPEPDAKTAAPVPAPAPTSVPAAETPVPDAAAKAATAVEAVPAKSVLSQGVADGDWVIVIRPNVWDAGYASVSEPTPVAVTSAPVVSASTISAPCCGPVRLSYADALAEIGFSRAEYEANPAYRHEAAMELMFGQLRPTTVVKQTVPYFSRYPDMFRLRNAVYPYANTLGANTVNLRHFWFQQWYW